MGTTTSAATDPSYRRVPLARSNEGEPFMVPADAYAWRVRRFRNPGRPGACELVYGDDAAPLEIGIDTPIAEFRELVGNRAGRYRLDAIDGDGVGVPKLPPAYLQIEATDARPTMTTAPAAAVDPMLEMMREMMQTTRDLARENAALARAVIDRFPAMMDSAAGLLRAADGAGLPQRAPTDPRNAGAVVVANDNQDDDDDEIDDDGWPATVAHVVDQLVPMVQMIVAHRMGGAAPRNATAHPAPREEAGRREASAARPSAAPSSAPAPSAPAPSAPAPSAPAPEAPRASDAPAPEAPRAPTPDQLAHFAAIQIALTPREGQIARALVAELRPDAVAAWLRELCALSVPDAVALIRRHLAQTAPRSKPATPELERPKTGHSSAGVAPEPGVRKPDINHETPTPEEPTR